MKLLAAELRERLLANGRTNRRAGGLPRERSCVDHADEARTAGHITT